MFKKILIRNKASDAPAGGTNVQSAMPTPPLPPPPMVTPAASTAAVTDAPAIKEGAPQSAELKAAGSNNDAFDDYGYAKSSVKSGF